MGAVARFTERDVTRAMAGASRAGFTRVRVHIDPLGNIVIDGGNEPMQDKSFDNPLDKLIFGDR